MAKNTEISRHKLSMAEVITILITFHLGGFRNLKHYYEFYVKKHLSKYFPKTVSYNRFVELQQSVLFVMTLFLKIAKLGKDTGIAFVDSTPLRICKNKRIPNSIRNTKTFTNIAARGKSTMGYFYGFKLHLIINEMGEILNFVITPGNVDESKSSSSITTTSNGHAIATPQKALKKEPDKDYSSFLGCYLHTLL